MEKERRRQFMLTTAPAAIVVPVVGGGSKDIFSSQTTTRMNKHEGNREKPRLTIANGTRANNDGPTSDPHIVTYRDRVSPLQALLAFSHICRVSASITITKGNAVSQR